MRFDFDISERLDNTLDALLKVNSMTMTSLNIIGEVMNIPLPALECIWRKTGEKDIDPSSLCIDEERLELFAEAFIRKMKNYFERSIRDFDVLSSDDRNDLLAFYNHFKTKEGFVLTSKSTWNNIDKDKLHEAFLHEVREKTDKYRVETYGGILDKFIFSIPSEALDSMTCDTVSIFRSDIRVVSDSHMFYRITHNSRYLSPHSNGTGKYNRHYIVNNRLRKVFRSARFYIYVADDNSNDDINGSSESVKHICIFNNKTIWTRKDTKNSLIISEKVTFQ